MGESGNTGTLVNISIYGSPVKVDKSGIAVM
jgi:hypothetical protein